MKHNFVMPSASDYQAAIQNPGLCFKDKELAASSPIRSASGLPSSASGRFAIVFPLENHSKNIAVRCFTIFYKDQEKRYTLIDKALKQAKLPFFVDFAYKDEGIYLDNRWFPVLKMDWIEGKLLDQYILDNRKAPEKLDSVKNELISIFRALKKNSIAHCDLQPGNIIVTDKGIKLVDYDGLFVPRMEGMKRNELGQPNYQHPALTEEDFDEEMDEFSIWTILLSITALQFNPGLLTEKTFEREYILFQQSDFKEPNNSQMFNELKKIPDKKFQKLLKEFSVMCKEQILEEYAIDHDWSVKSRVEKKQKSRTNIVVASGELIHKDAKSTESSLDFDESSISTSDFISEEPRDSSLVINLGKRLSLQWNFVKASTYKEIRYDVYFGERKDDLSPVALSHKESWIHLSDMIIGDKRYYWFVVARSGHSIVAKSSIWTFRTRLFRSTHKPFKMPLKIPQMELVNRSSFTMGDTWGDGSDEQKPAHIVELTYDFLIGKYEVTFDQYDWFCEETGRNTPSDKSWGRGNRPVINVSWNDAIAYCNWLSEKEKLPKAYDDKGNLLDKDGRVTTDPSKVVGYRLPTEAEWEYAARGGNKSRGYQYAGSSTVGDVAWYTSNSVGKTQEVGKKAPNELGLYDMSGNVWEWCSDWYGGYSSSAQTNLYNSTPGSDRVIRGGSRASSMVDILIANRRGVPPNNSGDGLGFRVCRKVTPRDRCFYESSNPSPSNNATNQPLALTLSWNCSDVDSDSDGNPLTYDIYFDTNITPMTKVSSSQVENTLNRSNLSHNTTYYWKVVAKDNKGGVTEGPVWSFTTTSRPPNPPSSPSPSNNAIKQPTALSLSWECSDPDGDTLTYDVYFDTNANPTTKVSSSQTVNSLSIKDLSYNTTYYWKVVAKDSKGATTEGPLWRFSTRDIDALPYKLARTLPSTVLVEKGSFVMGDTWGDGSPTDKPTHKVMLTYDFHIGKYETTFDEYDAFCEATGRSKPEDEGWGRGNRPVVWVSWNDAIAYCNWLSEKEKLPKAYDSNGDLLDKDGRITTNPSKVVGYRLPTEAEWEYAARGGNKSNGYRYSGSDNLDEVAWYEGNSGGKTHEVGKKMPNELGIYDMSGNVEEWCSDRYNKYSGSTQINPYNKLGARWWSGRIHRGGCFFSRKSENVASRSYSDPDVWYYYSSWKGFRICRTTLRIKKPKTLHNESQLDNEVKLHKIDQQVQDKDKLNAKDNIIGIHLESSDSLQCLTRTKNLPMTKFMVIVNRSSFNGEKTSEYSRKAIHKYRVTHDFIIGKYELTFDEYDAFCEATGISKPKDEGWGRGSRPVINVSWWNAIAYCNWLSEKEKLPKAYDSNGNLLDKDGMITTDPSKVSGYRLPTEAEWEYAARGGNKSKGYKYSGSDNVDDVAWYTSNSGRKTQEVGKKMPNELGIYDMSGNVLEWLEYNSKDKAGFKGGCFFDADKGLIIEEKIVIEKKYLGNDVGFRIVRTTLDEDIVFCQSPKDCANNQSTNIKLNWSITGNIDKSLKFDVYVAKKGSEPVLVAANLANSGTEIKGLEFGETYFWGVVVKNSNGPIKESAIWTFTTYSLLELVRVNISSLANKNLLTSMENLIPDEGKEISYDLYVSPDLVTYEDKYGAFCKATGRELPKSADIRYGNSKPVVNIDWSDAIEYCNWLSIMEGFQAAYDANGNMIDLHGRITTNLSKVTGYRLPTRSECEQFSTSSKAGVYYCAQYLWEWCSDSYTPSINNDLSRNTLNKYPYKLLHRLSSSAITSERDRIFGKKTPTPVPLLCVPTIEEDSVVGAYKSEAMDCIGMRIVRTVYVENSEPSSPDPYDGAFWQKLSLTLSWLGNEESSFDVYLGTEDAKKTLVASRLRKTSIKVINLIPSTNYYWKVVEKRNDGRTIEGQVWTFRTRLDLSKYEPSNFVPKVVLVENSRRSDLVEYDFVIGRYQVTFDEYDAFCEEMRKDKPSDAGWGRGKRPVINVSWWDVIAYCNWLSEKEGIPGAYDKYGNLLDEYENVAMDLSKVVGYRLPTEAEWEYAARGGNKGKGYKYSGSDNVNDVAWYFENSGRKTQEVGRKLPNELGIYDMSGNVWEWCSDGSRWVCRGGGWGNGATFTRVADCSGGSPTSAYYYLGFRIARTVF